MSETIIRVPVTLHVSPDTEAVRLTTQGDQQIEAELGYAVTVSARPYTGRTEITPTEEEQTLETTDLLMQDDITVHAIPDTYVGSAIPQRDAGDLTASADTVSAPAGYYADAASRAVAAGSATTPTGGIEVTPSISVGSDGKITASVSKSETITPIVVPGYVASGTAGTISISGSSSQQMTVRESSDLVVRDDTVTVPAGYYPSEAAAGIKPGSATTPATTISATPSISVSSGGLITSAVSASQQVTPAVSAGYVSGGTAGTVSVSGSATEQLNTQPGTTITPTTAEQTAVPAGTYTTGDIIVDAMPNGVRGSGTISASTTSTKQVYQLNYNNATSGYYPASTVANPAPVQLTRQTETVTPDETGMDVAPTGKFYYLEKVTVDPIPSNYVGSAVPQKTSADLTASGATVTAPAGYYANSASKAVASGAVGLPYGSKGNVTNHTIKVTPFVTSVTGYIVGETRTGNAVTVAASELVSGTKSITANGTSIDVTNYAAVDVAVPSGSPNLQDKTVSYTPTETAQSEAVTAGTGYDGLGTVTVNVGAISDTYVGSAIPTKAAQTYNVTTDYDQTIAAGTYLTGAQTFKKMVLQGKTVTANGYVTADAGFDALGSVTVNVSGGGASNIITGTFTAPAAGTEAKVTLGYTGSGYPIMAIIAVDGGSYASGTTFYDSTHRYAIAQFAMTKGNATTAPSYETTGTANYGVVSVIYKNSTSVSTTYTRTSTMSANTFSASNANSTSTTAMRFRSKTSMSVFSSANSGTSYGFLAGTVYRYWIAYSS